MTTGFSSCLALKIGLKFFVAKILSRLDNFICKLKNQPPNLPIDLVHVLNENIDINKEDSYFSKLNHKIISANQSIFDTVKSIK